MYRAPNYNQIIFLKWAVNITEISATALSIPAIHSKVQSSEELSVHILL